VQRQKRLPLVAFLIGCLKIRQLTHYHAVPPFAGPGCELFARV
jgi:hypothetical protein